ncbi:MAG TPA: hypothetical protein VFH31_19505, partial [Pyrinomonadaceae bacterium]|nr:hypothetical protein [Pyrinomonadaceae bacterium]
MCHQEQLSKLGSTSTGSEVIEPAVLVLSTPFKQTEEQILDLLEHCPGLLSPAGLPSTERSGVISTAVPHIGKSSYRRQPWRHDPPEKDAARRAVGAA